MKKNYLILCVLLCVSFISKAQNKINTITDAGAWCWFSDPRAIYLHGDRSGVLTGWVKSDGSIEAALINPKTGDWQSQILYPQLEKDDHDNPAFVELPDQNYMAFYAKHVKQHLYYQHASTADSSLFDDPITYDPIDPKVLARYPRGGVTYTNPYVLSKEDNRIYCMGRWTGFKPNIMWSDDLGQSFTKSKVFIAEEGFEPSNRPYVKYYSDGKSRIHIIFTDGHPRNESLNSVYYAYYEAGAFWKADGSKICNIDQIPFAPEQATVVYQATTDSGRAWVYDIVADKKGRPTILYARYPSEEEHLYYYAQYDGKQWHDSFICNSGQWFPQTVDGQTEKEPHYSAGMVLHPRDPNTVYLSRSVAGVFEIEKWTTQNQGKDWSSTAMTSGSSKDNVRPYIPRNMQRKDQPMLLWMENDHYVHYTNYKSAIKYVTIP
ncbi:BNR repeat-containing protein [Reichenbachiella agarivorans]|uniref:BNR repeat-containing protein n=1 Tax=Reichenbachiella agarivorans TaxID=2979464 RepID=A0ABY6CRP7_9BACT|nr:BNR repeat-containing protein [Reichenbachiella agarivorans]UXP32038.1 BNR repeat-containing protein [Reichenbachiella agarivorans]